jgi:hypothetical protein
MREISTITIRYSEAKAATRLDSMLTVLGEMALATTWKVRSVECVGAQADRLHAVSDSGSPVHGTDLAEIASGVDQVIDGEFRAYGAGEEEAWLVLRAVDSTSWDVASPREDILNRFRAAYKVFEAGKMDWGS